MVSITLQQSAIALHLSSRSNSSRLVDQPQGILIVLSGLNIDAAGKQAQLRRPLLLVNGAAYQHAAWSLLFPDSPQKLVWVNSACCFNCVKMSPPRKNVFSCVFWLDCIHTNPAKRLRPACRNNGLLLSFPHVNVCSERVLVKWSFFYAVRDGPKSHSICLLRNAMSPKPMTEMKE